MMALVRRAWSSLSQCYFWLGVLSSSRMKCECHDRAGGEEWTTGDCRAKMYSMKSTPIIAAVPPATAVMIREHHEFQGCRWCRVNAEDNPRGKQK